MNWGEIKPKGKTNHKVTKDRKDEQDVEAVKDYADSIDEKSFVYIDLKW